jgi:hypothetical protein
MEGMKDTMDVKWGTSTAARFKAWYGDGDGSGSGSGMWWRINKRRAIGRAEIRIESAAASQTEITKPRE